MIYNVTIFGIHLKLNPVAFTLPIGENGWDVYWYGIIIALGFLLAIIYAYRNAKRYGIDVDRMLDVILVTTPLAILCARTYYVVFDPYSTVDGIKDFFGLGSGSGVSGLAIYGGVIGAVLVGGIMCLLRKVKILDMYDLAATGFLLAQGIGRWGNFVNQEAFGGRTGSTFWGMSSENTIYEVGYGLVHPCFLYESVWCIAGFFVLNAVSKKRKFSGEIALLYGVWYGFGRAIIEMLRTDSLMIGELKVSVLLSVLLFVACGITLIAMLSRYKSDKTGTEYVGMFGDITEDNEQPEEDNSDISENVEDSEGTAEETKDEGENGNDVD